MKNLLNKNKLLAGIVSGASVKMIGLVLSMAAVPLTYKGLGEYNYGIWVNIVLILAWLSMMDFGIANGLTPLVAMALAKKDYASINENISAAIWLLIFISVIGVLIVLVVAWYFLMEKKYEHDVVLAISIAAVFYFIGLPLSVSQRVFLAHQDGYLANVWQLFSSIFGLAMLYFATISNYSLVGYVVNYWGGQLIVSALAFFWMILYKYKNIHLKSIVKKSSVINIFGVGKYFFMSQIASLLFFNKDNFLVAKFYGVGYAGGYSIVWQMFMYLIAVNLAISPYVGPAFSAAYAKNDNNLMKKICKRYLFSVFLFVFVGSLFIYIYCAEIIKIWIGSELGVDRVVVFWMAVWAIVLGIQWPIMTLLNGTGDIRRYTKFFMISAVIGSTLSYLLLEKIGVEFGLVASCCVVMLISVPISVSELIKKINKNEACDYSS